MGWKSEAADFLVKLLIKKPELRLGKYGSFEVFNHPWLCNCEWSQSFVQPSIHLVEPYFEEKILESFQEERK
jgi:serine/threonine protein kinase